MRRRRFVQASASGAVLAALPRLAGAAAARPAGTVWAELRRRVGDRLVEVHSPLIACAEAGGAGADALFARLKNPFYLGDEPGLTQTLGWVDAWTGAPSAAAVLSPTAAIFRPEKARASRPYSSNFSRTARTALTEVNAIHS